MKKDDWYPDTADAKWNLHVTLPQEKWIRFEDGCVRSWSASAGTMRT